MRVLVFGSITSRLGTRALVRALSPFANVAEFNWRYKSIPSKVQYAPLRIFYRTLECVYWTLRLFKKASKFQADVIIAEFAYFTGLIGAIAGKLSRKPCIIRAIGSDLKVGAQALLVEGAIFRFQRKKVSSWALKNASGVICVSKDLENIAKSLGAKSSIVIPPPIDFSEFKENSTCAPRKDRVIISVANLTPVKGMSYLIRAMRSINDGKLVIIGDGPERKDLESLSLNLGLSDRVLFLGWVNHGLRFWNHLRNSTVFVLPSISEGFPRALIEAMACGLPVVATKVGGVPDVIRDGVNGYLVPSRDEEALSEAIEKVLNNINFRKSASYENKKVAKDYIMSAIGRKIYYYLEEDVIKARGRPNSCS
ncbi:MAG: glycosyltransferase [Candidatus Hodarchaeota archaeon]